MCFNVTDESEINSALHPEGGTFWGTGQIVGPYDAFMAVYIRKQLTGVLSLGRELPVDMFVLSVGESPSGMRRRLVDYLTGLKKTLGRRAHPAVHCRFSHNLILLGREI